MENTMKKQVKINNHIIENISSNYDLDWGFAWIEFDLDGERVSLQACLERDEENENYILSVDWTDCGWDWGISEDNNKLVVEKLGKEESFNLLKQNLDITE